MSDAPAVDMGDAPAVDMGDAPDVDIAVIGDVHGAFDARADTALVERADLLLCTGDLTPTRADDRFAEGMRIARELAAMGALTVLGNHDGPTPWTGRPFPRAYHRLAETLGDCHVAGRRIDRPDLGLSIVGGRPLSVGGPKLHHPVPGRESWSAERWGEEVAALAAAAPCPRVVILAHCGPTGLGDERDAPYGRDFTGDGPGDWGDGDLRHALRLLADVGAPRVVAVVAGHMHHAVRGGGTRRWQCPDPELPGVLNVNAAVVPRVDPDGRRAMVTLAIRGSSATARLEWHEPSE